MKRVLLRFYSTNNLGDDLFIRVVAERYSNSMSVISHGRTSTAFRGYNVHVHKNQVLHGFYRLVEIITKRNNIWLKTMTKKHDLLLYVGGSIFIEQDKLDVWREELNFYSTCKIPYYIIGSNVGPYKTNEFKNILSEIFAKASDVCFRDSASYDLFKDVATTRIATDVAFSLNIKEYNRKSEKIAVFSIIDTKVRFKKHLFDRYEEEIINLSKVLIRNGYEVVFMSFCSYEGDEKAIKRILERADAGMRAQIKTFAYVNDLDEALDLLARCEIVVGTRFHAVILGLLFAKKVLPVVYSHKTINILKDMRFGGPIVDISKIDEFDGRKFNFDNLQIHDVGDQVALSELQFQELDKILEKRQK